MIFCNTIHYIVLNYDKQNFRQKLGCNDISMVHAPEIKSAYKVKCQKKFCVIHNEDT